MVRVVEIETVDGPMRVHESRNPVRDRGAVIVLQEALGANDHLLDLVARFGAAGFHAVAPELYHRTGVTRIEYGDYDTIYAQVAAVSDSTFLVDVDATVGYLTGCGWSPGAIGAVGFNLGARVSFLVAAQRELGAAVGFYGAGIVTAGANPSMPSLIPLSSPLGTPWLGLHGERDRTVPVADIDRLELALAGEHASIVRYSDAGHAFHSDARPELYDAAAARDAWKRAIGWLEGNLDLLD